LRRIRSLRREAVGQAYCSTANLGAGFDCFGLALNKYSDRVQIRFTQLNKIRLAVKGAYSYGVPKDSNQNSAGPPAVALLERARLKKGLFITIDKNVPQGLGLGSSGATAAACTKTLDHLLDLGLSDDELVRVASLGERAVAGTAHADNVGASLLGGFVIVFDNPVRTISIKPPSKLRIVVATPGLRPRRNKTRIARGLVPRRIETEKALLNVGRASAIATGFSRGDIELIGAAMSDEIAEPRRSRLIPSYDNVKRLAFEAGASGVAISGAGPSLAALVDETRHSPRMVSRAMVQGFAQKGVQASSFVARPAPEARIVRSR
jgi:homoserine kinase